ncbi:unnamed protein product [Dovyalis caffra]|uniref:Uncharacterized protein n=1 Tax=Dovyalis caffra TaxID=77055 RepID=A0AAV1SEC9_9ROSI|nr:unnamed protein product [Dovyalis caffra]
MTLDFSEAEELKQIFCYATNASSLEKSLLLLLSSGSLQVLLTIRFGWMKLYQIETKTPTTGNLVEINEEIFVGDNDTTYEVISNMLSTASVLVDVLVREKIILEIIAKGLALIYVKCFSGVEAKLLIEVEIHVVSTHGLTQEFGVESNGCRLPATKRLKVGGHGQD